MLLVQEGVRFLERLQLRNLASGARRRRVRGSTAEPAITRVLPPLRQHKGMNLQRGGHRLHLQSRLLTEPDGGEFELVAVLPNRSWPLL